MSKLLQLLVIITLLGCAAPTYKQGVIAYNKGDTKTAFRAFEPLAEKNFPPAQGYLAAMYYYGTDSTPKNHVLAAQWFRKAADNGFAEAQYNLAVFYQQGIGVEKDPVESLNLLNKSAKQGFPQAKRALASKDGSTNNTNWGLIGLGAAALLLLLEGDHTDEIENDCNHPQNRSSRCGTYYDGNWHRR